MGEHDEESKSEGTDIESRLVPKPSVYNGTGLPYRMPMPPVPATGVNVSFEYLELDSGVAELKFSLAYQFNTSAQTTTRSALISILKHSRATIFSQLFSQAGTSLRRSFLSRSGGRSTAIAASAIGPLNYLIATAAAGAVKASSRQLNSAKNDPIEVGKRWRMALSFASMVWAGSGVFYLGSPLLLPYIGKIDHSAVSTAFDYNILILFSAPFALYKAVNRSLFVAIEKQNWMLPLPVLQFAVMAPSSYCLGHLLGVFGISAGKVMGGAACFAATMAMLYHNKPFKPYHLFSKDMSTCGVLAAMAREGGSNALSYMIESGVNLAMMIMMSHIGEDAFIANMIASQAIRVFTVLAFCLGIGMQKYLNADHSYAPIKAGVAIALVLNALMFGLIPLSDSISSLFIDVTAPKNEMTLAIVKELISWQVFLGFGDLIRNIFDGVQQHFGHNSFTFKSTLLCRGVIAQGLSVGLAFCNGPMSMIEQARTVTICQLSGMAIGGLFQLGKSIYNIRESQYRAYQEQHDVELLEMSDHGYTRMPFRDASADAHDPDGRALSL